ncbi:MAG: hypothetical protein ACE5M4_14290 [Anaerolineales bacterium]
MACRGRERLFTVWAHDLIPLLESPHVAATGGANVKQIRPEQLRAIGTFIGLGLVENWANATQLAYCHLTAEL